jgi:probable addiction module antidote protein
MLKKLAIQVENGDCLDWVYTKALWECLKTNDPEGFKEILKAHLELRNKENLTQKTGISRRTLYRMLSKRGNPTLQNISKLVHKLCA